jgi:RNA polymerase sigma factor (sigma-70 family)
MQQSDSQIWDAFTKGDRQAFEWMYRREVKSLMSYGYTLVKNEMQVEDALHELFVDLWSTRERLSPNDNIKSYLIVSLRRKLLKPVKINTQDIDTTPIQDAALSFEQAIIGAEQSKIISQHVRSAMDQLTDKQKEIVNLKFFQEMDYEQIAATMDISYQSCRNLLSSAIKGLKTHVDKNKLYLILISLIQFIF